MTAPRTETPNQAQPTGCLNAVKVWMFINRFVTIRANIETKFQTKNPVLKNYHLHIVIHSLSLAQFFSPQVTPNEVTKALSSCCLGGDLAHAKSLHKINFKLFSSGLRPFIANAAARKIVCN